MIRLTLNVVVLPGPPELAVKNGKLHKLTGECNRCGDCCKLPGVPYPTPEGPCEKLRMNDDAGVVTGECTIQWIKPWCCAMWPRDPDEALPERCGFEWVEV